MRQSLIDPLHPGAHSFGVAPPLNHWPVVLIACLAGVLVYLLLELDSNYQRPSRQQHRLAGSECLFGNKNDPSWERN